MQYFFLFMFDSPVQIAMVVGVVVLIFGAGKLPQLAKSLGQSRKAFKEGMREAEEDEANNLPKITSSTAPPQLPVSAISDDALMEEMRRRTEAKTS